MSSIVLVISDLGDRSGKAQSLLMSSFSLSTRVVNSAIATRSPVLQKQLFDRKNPEFPEKLLEVMEQLRQLGTAFTVFELLEGQTYVPEGSYYQITPERLRTMMSAREQSLEHQRRLGGLEN